jgi:hypothetical protein
MILLAEKKGGRGQRKDRKEDEKEKEEGKKGGVRSERGGDDEKVEQRETGRV